MIIQAVNRYFIFVVNPLVLRYYGVLNDSFGMIHVEVPRRGLE